MVTPMNWIRTNVATSAALGVLALALVGGGTAVAVTSAQQATTESATPSSTPSSLPTSAASEDPFTATGPTTTAPTTPDGSAPPSSGQPSAGQPDATAPEPPATEPEPHTEPAPVTPDAPAWVNISPDGDGFAVSWADAPMNGLTLKYYRVGVANPSYTSGEEYTTGGTWLSIPGVTSGNNCAFITAVATNGTVGPTSSVCTDLW